MLTNAEIAYAIVREHLDWHRNGRPMPVGGFPPDYFADELREAIEKALNEKDAAVEKEREDAKSTIEAMYDSLVASRGEE